MAIRDVDQLLEEMELIVLRPAGRMDDEQFVELCSLFPDAQIEAEADGEVRIMPPTFSETSHRSAEIVAQLRIWAVADGRGRYFDSSGGFVLPDGARRSPDASWISFERIAQLTPEQRRGFYPLCPEFLIELRSATDRLPDLKRKMEQYLANGCELGWLIDPKAKCVWIYRPGREAEHLCDVNQLAGEGPVAGFTLDINPIWA